MSSPITMNPTGGVNMRRGTESPNPNICLLEQILDRDNMLRAWLRVKSNKGVAGVDKMKIDDFPGFARDHWQSIRQSLLDGSYQPLLANVILDDL